MKTSGSSSQRGSALVTTVIFCAIMLALIGSMLRYAVSERRTNNRAKLLLEARAAAEAISEYGIAQVKNVLESNRTFTDSVWSTSDQTMFTTGLYAGTVTMPPSTFWGGGHIVTTGTTEQPLMHVGKITQAGAGGLYFIDPTVVDNENDPLKGKRVFRYDVDILSRATATDSYGSGNVTKYMKQSFSIRAVPLFSNAVYYNMDLEVWPGPTMTITGSTHTNQHLFARTSSSNPLSFMGPVTAVKGIWGKFVGMPWCQYVTYTGAVVDNATSTGTVSILPAGATVAKAMQLTSATTGYAPNLTSGTWVESTWNLTGSTYANHLASTETTTSKLNYANWTSATFKGNVLTHVNGVGATNLQGIPDYSYVYGSVYPTPPYLSTNDTTNRARALIERPMLTSETGFVQAEEDIKYSRLAGLYIVANTTSASATGHKPDGTAITVLARSYRAFANDTSTTPATITEVLLPGQNTFGDTGTANPYTAHKNARPIIQMNDIDFDSASGTYNQETAAARRMTDMRRTGVADANLASATTTFSHSATRSSSNAYIPKNLFMIDLDMNELKKAVQTISVTVGATFTTTGSDFYKTGLPTSTNWVNHVHNPAAVTTNESLSDTTRIITATSTAATHNNAFTTTSWNGAVYVESIAADIVVTGSNATETWAKTHNNRNSGVRLINGRGKVASIGLQGFTLATNDAVYILGHFNADGLASTPSTVSVTVPPSPGASTGHNYETGELPASIAADAITLLSEPVNTASGSTPNGQSNGWNDKFSPNYCSYAGGGNYSSSWATTAPSNSNTRDGANPSAAYGYKVPYDSSSGSWSAGGSTSDKLNPAFTEYSVAMLCGLVPTGKNGVNQNSGGLHNFPRFLEDWDGVECRIRGSMVALFECRVETEPWSLRVYCPPDRIWGFNLLYDTGVMPPLTPKTIHFRRIGANDITKADYNAKLTTWGYTVLP